MIAEICPLLPLSLRPLSHTILLQNIPNYSRQKIKRERGGEKRKQYSFNPIKADILLTHSNSLLKADARDIMEMIH